MGETTTTTSNGHSKADLEADAVQEEKVQNHSSEGSSAEKKASKELKITFGNPVKTFYDSVVINGEAYKIGDHVYVNSEEDEPSIAQITALYNTADNNQVTCKWYFRPSDTKKSREAKEAHSKELFASNESDDTPLESIEGKCEVKQKKDIEDLEAWSSQPHHYHFVKWYQSSPAQWYTKDPATSRHHTPAKVDHDEPKETPKRSKVSRTTPKTTPAKATPKLAKSPRPTPKVVLSRIARATPTRVTRSKTTSSTPAKATPTKTSSTPKTASKLDKADRPKGDTTTKLGVTFGALINEEGGEKYYDSFTFDDEKYSLGDHIYLQPSVTSDLPYILVITTILRDTLDRPYLAGNWYYRWDNLPPRVQSTVEWDASELYRSSDSDYNSIGAVLGKCAVNKYEDVEKELKDYTKGSNNFYYRLYYDSVKKKLTEKEPPVIEKSFVVDLESEEGEEEAEEQDEQDKEKEAAEHTGGEKEDKRSTLRRRTRSQTKAKVPEYNKPTPQRSTRKRKAEVLEKEASKSTKTTKSNDAKKTDATTDDTANTDDVVKTDATTTATEADATTTASGTPKSAAKSKRQRKTPAKRGKKTDNTSTDTSVPTTNTTSSAPTAPTDATATGTTTSATPAVDSTAATTTTDAPATPEPERKKRKYTKRTKKSEDEAAATAAAATNSAATTNGSATPGSEAASKPKRKYTPRKPKEPASTTGATNGTTAPGSDKPKRKYTKRTKKGAEVPQPELAAAESVITEEIVEASGVIPDVSLHEIIDIIRSTIPTGSTSAETDQLPQTDAAAVPSITDFSVPVPLPEFNTPPPVIDPVNPHSPSKVVYI